MKSLATPDFWDCYNALQENIRRRADEAFELWLDNPRHPSIRFQPKGPFWSACVTDDYRALAEIDGDTVIWFFYWNPQRLYENIRIDTVCCKLFYSYLSHFACGIHRWAVANWRRYCYRERVKIAEMPISLSLP